MTSKLRFNIDQFFIVEDLVGYTTDNGRSRRVFFNAPRH